MTVNILSLCATIRLPVCLFVCLILSLSVSLTERVIEPELASLLRGHSGDFLLHGFEAFDGGKIGFQDNVQLESLVFAFVNVFLVLSLARSDEG